MDHAIVIGDQATLLSPGQPFVVGDVQYPRNVPDLWSAEELAEIGVYSVTDDPIPAGQVATGSALAVVDGRPVRHWTLASFEYVQAAKIAALTAACGSQIVGGFTSSALGAPHLYPSKAPNDQINLMGSVTDSLLPGLPPDWTTPFWCQDGAGTWAFVPHTAAQIQQAGRDGKTNVATCQAKLATLSAEVMAATTVDTVNAIAW